MNTFLQEIKDYEVSANTTSANTTIQEPKKTNSGRGKGGKKKSVDFIQEINIPSYEGKPEEMPGSLQG